MRMTLFADYALRVLLYLTVRDEGLVSIKEIAGAYKISKNHLMKVVQELGRLGLVDTVRGRDGGIKLAKAPGEINIGYVIRRTEPDFELVECFNKRENTCCVEPACALKPALAEAQAAFLKSLDKYTLKDLMPQKRQLVQLLTSASKK
jgi:Rrf2 family nitric oxide-sensitive transcriptional repressor